MCFIKIGNADTFNNNLVIDNIARVYIIVICDDIIVCQNTPDLFNWWLWILLNLGLNRSFSNNSNVTS